VREPGQPTRHAGEVRHTEPVAVHVVLDNRVGRIGTAVTRQQQRTGQRSLGSVIAQPRDTARDDGRRRKVVASV
jgi:hypothetical protein